MDNLKLIKKSIIYFVPVVLAHIIFTLIDKNIQLKGGSVDIRLSVIHLSIYFYFFVVPIFLMIVNVVYNVKNDIKVYYDEMKFGGFSILGANISVLIINIISLYFIKSPDINVIVEFFIIFIPELIMFAMISFLGGYLVKKKDEDCEEETLEGLKIPKREIEFYKEDETDNKYKNASDVMIEKNDNIGNEEKSIEKQYEESAEYKCKMKEENDHKEEISSIDNWKEIKQAISDISINDHIEKLDEKEDKN